MEKKCEKKKKTPRKVYRYDRCCRLNKKNFPLSKYDHNTTRMLSAGQVKTVNRYIEDFRDTIHHLGDFSSFHVYFLANLTWNWLAIIGKRGSCYKLTWLKMF